MQFRSRLFVAALVGVTLLASSALAANVTYTIDLTGAPGTFNLFADSTAGDNGGLASYGIVLTGPILTLDHNSPKSAAASGPGGFGPAGFTSLRTADGVTTLLASQDTITPTANLIYGFGQESSSFVAKGMTSFDPMTEGAVWNAHLLLATGTYNPASGEPGFNESSFDTFANVFTANGVNQVTPATEAFVIDRGIIEQFVVDDLGLGDRLRGSLVTGGPLGTNDSDDPDSVAWTLLSFSGPGGAVVGATVDPASGVFSWQSLATSELGPYSATIQGVNATGTPIGTDSGILSFNLVPEPASVTLLGLAMFGAIGFIRRR